MRLDKPKCDKCGKPMSEHYSGKCRECRTIRCPKCNAKLTSWTLRNIKSGLSCDNCKRIERAKILAEARVNPALNQCGVTLL